LNGKEFPGGGFLDEALFELGDEGFPFFLYFILDLADFIAGFPFLSLGCPHLFLDVVLVL